MPLQKATAATTVSALQTFFSNFGLPDELVSDNGPQFMAQTFTDFCKLAFTHPTIPPRFEWGRRTLSTSGKAKDAKDGTLDTVERKAC